MSRPYPDRTGIYVDDGDSALLVADTGDGKYWLWCWLGGTLPDSWQVYEAYRDDGTRSDNLLQPHGWTRLTPDEYYSRYPEHRRAGE